MSCEKSKRICSFVDCGRPSIRKSELCRRHFTQQSRGTPLRPIRHMRAAGEPPRVDYDLQPCPVKWLVGSCHIFRYAKMNGYGVVALSRSKLEAGSSRTIVVHRYVWEQAHGPIPPKMYVDHQCRVRACCNIDHLRLVDHRTNDLENSESIAARNVKKTHCPRGHRYDEANTYLQPQRNGRTSRVCRKCRCEQMKLWYQNHRRPNRK